MAISEAQKAFWQENGYLVLPKLFSDTEIESIESTAKDIWKSCPSTTLVDSLVTGRRSFMNELSEEEKKQHFKVMDLYLEYPSIRERALDSRLTEIISALLGSAPVLGATLNFEKSSQQDYHVDSIYLTPETEGHLVATWIALEDVHPDSGALQYIPGSHKIATYTFSDGGKRAIMPELPKWREYIMSEVEKRGLKPQTFPAKKGDVFIWHADLVHSGSPIKNYDLTRKSLVSHYFSLTDSKTLGRKLVPLGKGFWHQRPPVGTVKQLSERLPAAAFLKRFSNKYMPQAISKPVKGALKRLLGLQ
jgi:phytanoyl-CoA hydroxylase